MLQGSATDLKQLLSDIDHWVINDGERLKHHVRFCHGPYTSRGQCVFCECDPVSDPIVLPDTIEATPVVYECMADTEDAARIIAENYNPAHFDR